MTNIFLALILITFLSILGILAFAFIKVRRFIVDFLEFEEGKQSKFGLLAESFAFMIARAITAQIKTTFMGIESGKERAISSLQGQMFENENPMAAGIMNMLPKSLKRNNMLSQLAAQFMANKLTAGAGPSGTGPSGTGLGGPAGNGSAPKFKLLGGNLWQQKQNQKDQVKNL